MMAPHGVHVVYIHDGPSWSTCGIYKGKRHHIFKQYCNILEQVLVKFDLVYSILLNTLNLGDMMTFLITLLYMYVYVYENLLFQTH